MSTVSKTPKKVLVVSALHQENEFAEKYISAKNNWRKIEDNWFVNEANQIELYIKTLGVGKVNAAINTTDAINQVNPDLVVNVGVAGGLDDSLKVGAVVIGTDYVQTDLKVLLPENATAIKETPEYLSNAIGKIAEAKGISYKKGRIATGDFVLYEGRKRRRIKKEFSPLAFDMETAAVAQVATVKNIDFVGIRSFSDMANRKTIRNITSSKKKGLSEEKRASVFNSPIELIIDYIESIA